MALLCALGRLFRGSVLSSAIKPVVRSLFRGPRLEPLEDRRIVSGPLALGSSTLLFDGPWQDVLGEDHHQKAIVSPSTHPSAADDGGATPTWRFPKWIFPSQDNRRRGGGGGGRTAHRQPLQTPVSSRRLSAPKPSSLAAGVSSARSSSISVLSIGATRRQTPSMMKADASLWLPEIPQLSSQQFPAAAAGMHSASPSPAIPRAAASATVGNQSTPQAPAASAVGPSTTDAPPSTSAAPAALAEDLTLPCQDGLGGWTTRERGGSEAGKGSVTLDRGGFLLREGDSFEVSLERELEIPENPGNLRFVYDQLSFDMSDTASINDAFEAALVDAAGNTLVLPYKQDRDAFFNITEGEGAALGGGASNDGANLSVDISSLAGGSPATLILRLVNNDHDTATRVRIACGRDDPPQATVELANDTGPAGGPAIYFSDKLTNDPQVRGTASDDGGVTKLQAQVDAGALLDITSSLAGGSFTFDPGTLTAGPHRISITATDSGGQTALAVIDFTVNSPPQANAGGNRTVSEGSDVAFNASASTDAEGIFSYRWTLDDGSAVDGLTALRHYAQEGTFLIVLTVTDTAASVDSDAINVMVSNSAAVIVSQDMAGKEGDSLLFSATFTDQGVLDTHTASIDWGDGTSSPAVVSEMGGSGSIRARHIYADNGRYTVTLRVSDDGGATGTRQSLATIQNVAPTLAAGISFEPQIGGRHDGKSDGGSDGHSDGDADGHSDGHSDGEGDDTTTNLAAVISGRFTDPGFTRASAPTAETFTGAIDWGDGTTENVVLNVVQGGEGVLTSGSLRASHVYPRGGIFTATLTITDDDGGSDSETLRFGIMRIDVVPHINLKSSGNIPVKILRDPGFDPAKLVVSSLRFGPAGAPEDHGKIHGDGSFGAMTHFATQLSGIRPTDSVAFLTAQLPDGTIFVGMDTIDIVNGSSRGRSAVIGTGAPKFFVADANADNVYRYTSTGATSGYFPSDFLNGDVRGIVANAAGDTLWQIDAATRAVTIQGPTGAFKGYWTASDVSRPTGISTDGRDIWIVDAGRKQVLHYLGGAARAAGVAAASDSFNLNAANANASDITTNGSRIWITDEGSDEVFVYDMSGGLLGRWKLDAGNSDASGITLNPAGGNDLWVVDRQDRVVYHYANSLARISGSATAGDTFNLVGANLRPEAIADPPVSDPNDPRSWLGANVGTFAALLFGADNLANRQKMVDQKLLDDGTFDTSKSTFPATLLETPWSLNTGGSGSHRGGIFIQESTDRTGAGSFDFVFRNELGPFRAGNTIDEFVFQSSDTIGDTVFDLGAPSTKAAVFNTIDHGPLPQEAIESTVYLSNDRVNWTQAVVERVWLEGYHPNLGIKWDGFVYAVGTGTDQPFRYASVIWGGPGSLQSDGDNEINGILGLNSDFEPVQVPPPTISLEAPANGSTFTTGATVLISGHAIAGTIDAGTQPGVHNSITNVTIGIAPVDALDGAGDFFTKVTIAPGPNTYNFLAIDEFGQTATASLTLLGVAQTTAKIDTTVLSDVAGFEGVYGRTSFNDRSRLLYADLAIHNIGSYPLDTPLLIGVRNISDPSVTVRGADGVTHDGIPYYDFSSLVADGTLSPNELTDERELIFFNPNRLRFNYELVLLGQLNRPPLITSIPDLELIAGRNYSYDVDAVDPDDDVLSYSLLSGPEGMTIDADTGLIDWNSTSADAGKTYDVSAQVSDGRGGTAQQHYQLHSIAPPPNRPPLFTSAPVLTATLAEADAIVDPTFSPGYVYDADAVDPDDDVLSYDLLVAPTGMSIDAASGIIHWAPTVDQIGAHPVSIKASDGRGGVATQSYSVTVLADPLNHPPVIVTDPVTRSLAGRAYQYDVDAIDADHDTLAYQLVSGPADLTINSSTGLIELPAAKALVGQYPITLRVTDGRGGADEQSYTLIISQPGDLTITSIDSTATSVDGQSLVISGTITATIKNNGPGAIGDPFAVVFFEDANHNGDFDEATDPIVGRSTITSLLTSGGSVTVTATASGTVRFPGSRIWGFVDAEKVIEETNENNNIIEQFCDCTIQPQVGVFDPVVEWNWNSSNVQSDALNVMNTPAVIDLNADGFPEVIFGATASRGGGNVEVGFLRALDGRTGAELFTVTDPNLLVNTASSVAVGDIDGDGKPEIIACDSSGARLIAFENDGTFKWRSGNLESIAWGAPSIADLDGDGKPEIIIGRQVLNNDGTLRWSGTLGSGRGVGPLSLVADVNMDGKPDVVAGNTIYNADGSVQVFNSGPDGYTAIGNFDNDPFPEIVLVSGGTVRLLEHTLAVKWGPVSIPGGGGGGPPTVADFDGDGQPEIGVAGAARYTVFETDGSVRWAAVTRDGSSNITGSSVFDFEGDGKAEVVYGDEVFLRVYDGVSGTVRMQVAKSSCTWHEYPLVADVDADGNAEIVAVANDNCGFGPQRGVIVYGSASDSWVPTRQIWNEFSYHINNVNDDGSIPIHETDSWSTHNTYRLNALTTPSGALNAPDLVSSYLRVSTTGNTRTLTARVSNSGTLFAPAGVNVSFYSQDPRFIQGALLGTGKTTTRLDPDAFEDVTITISSGFPVGDLFVQVDDDGTPFHRGAVRECNETNNLHHFKTADAVSIRGRKMLDIGGDGILSSSADVTVLGQDDPWLAGMPDGSQASLTDVAPAQSPAQVLGLPLRAGDLFTFSATGGTSNVGGNPICCPDGAVGSPQQHATNDENGISALTAPLNSLIGVFIGADRPDLTSAPPGLIYSFPGSSNPSDGVDTLILHPLLKQMFFIGDGLTSAGKLQQFVAPPGATRLFLGSMDGFQWSNNGGAFNVTVTEFEQGLPGWIIYLDQNHNRVRDAGDPFTNTDADGNYAFTGLPPGSYTVAEELKQGWQPTNPASGKYELTLNATDNATGIDFGNTQVIEEETGNRPPRFTTAPPAIAFVGQTTRYDADAVDLDHDSLTFDLPLAPTGMVIDPARGLIAWKPTADQIGRHDVLVRVSDGQGGIDLQGWSITVNPANSAPIITSQPHAPAIVGVRYEYQLRAVDGDGDPISFSIAEPVPAGMNIDAASGLLTWTPAANQTPTQHFTVIVQDNRGGQGGQVIDLPVVTSATNDPPRIRSTPRQTIHIGGNYLYAVDAIDPNGDPLTYKLDSAPAGMSIDDDGLVTWIPTANQLGPNNSVAIRVEDGRGGFATQTFKIVVTNQVAPNHAPTFTSSPKTTASTNIEYRYDATASDVDGDPIIFSLDLAPNGMAIDGATGQLRWNPNSDQTGPQNVVVRITDAQGGFATQSFAINVSAVNTPPAISSVPPTLASSGNAYVYALRASDVDEDSLAFSLSSAPAGMTIDASTGLIRWTPAASQLGLNTVSLLVSDGRGGSATQTYSIDVSTGAANHPPTITSTPTFNANALAPYSYDVDATDADGQVIAFSLLQAPDGMTIDAATGLIRWTAASIQAGRLHTVSVAATDTQGASAVQTFSVSVRDTNHAPAISSAALTTAPAGRTYRYDIAATDQDGDTLAYSLVNGPAGMVVDSMGRVSWAASEADAGPHDVDLLVADGRGGFATQKYTLTVGADTTAPVVSIFINKNPALLDDVINLKVTATDDVGVQTLTLTIDGVPVSLDTRGQGTFKITTLGQLDVVATASDESGNLGGKTVKLTVLDPTDVQAPVVSITSPADTSTITGPVSVIGTVSDSNLDFYTLSIAPVDGSDGFTEIFRGTANVSNGKLGDLDPTLLSNDSYVLRLFAEDTNGRQSTFDTLFSLSSDVKLGNFRLSFTDLTIAMGAFPLVIGRTYDTLTSNNSGQFGFGWRLEISDTDLKTSLPADPEAEEIGLFTGFQKGTRVFVTLPGGKRQGFTFRPRQAPGLAGSFLGILRPNFVADPGITSTLSVDTFDIAYFNDIDEFRSYFGDLPYNPADTAFGSGLYTLKTADGTIYKINGLTGDLQSVTDNNGNTLTISSDGVTSSNGTKVTFNHDLQGRITSITDLNGKPVRYAYSAAGDLVSVTDRAGNITRFEYRSDRPHYLDKVIDPLGHTGIRSEYGPDGRLSRLTDADGTLAKITFDPSVSLQKITDDLGNITVFGYDPRGNVVLQTNADGGTVQRTFDDNNNLLSETDPLGHKTSYTYDLAGNVLSRTNPLGEVTRWTYESHGKITSVTNPNGDTTVNTYDARGNLLTSTSPRGDATRFAYDSKGKVTRWEDPGGHVMSITYDSRSIISSLVDADGTTANFTVDANGNVVADAHVLNTANGPVQVNWVYQYDANDKLTHITGPDGAEVKMNLDAAGRQVGSVDALGQVSAYEWRPGGDLDHATGPDGLSIGVGYDALGRPNAITVPGGTISRTYDSMSRETSRTYPGGATVHQEWDAAGRRTGYSDALGNTTRFTYDDAGRLIKVERPGGAITRNTYDSSGNLLTTLDAEGNLVRYERDAFGNPTKITLGDNSSVSMVYDFSGRVVQRTDAAGGVWKYRYGASGAIDQVIDPAGRITGFNHDTHGIVNSMTDPLGRMTSLDFDTVGRLVSRTLPEGQQETRFYDDAGELVRKVDFDGSVHQYQYDAGGRLIRRTGPASDLEQRTYDEAGRLIAVSDRFGPTTLTRDSRGRITSYQGPEGVTVSYGHDLAGRTTSVSTTAGELAFTYNTRGEIASIANVEGTTIYTRDRLGRVTEQLLANGNRVTRSYDSAGHTTAAAYLTSGGATVYRIDYSRDSAGRITRTQESTGRVVDYTYDVMDRLATERIADPAKPAELVSYGYDAAGNLITRTDSSGTQTFSYDRNDRLVSDGRWTYSWLANGLLASRSDGVTTESYEYDAQARLTSFTRTGNNPVTITYEYGADGLLASRTVDGVRTVFVWDRSNSGLPQLLEERTAAGTVITRYAHDENSLTQLVDGSGDASFLFGDHLGTVRAVIGANGQVRSTPTYDAYGRLRGGALAGNIGYTGAYTDPLTGMVFMRSRWYSPEASRFITPDSADPSPMQTSTFNRYMYAGSNPVNRSDPTGQFSMAEMSVVLTVVSILVSLAIVAFPSIPDMIVRGIFGSAFDSIGSLDALTYPFFSGGVQSGIATASVGLELLRFLNNNNLVLYLYFGVGLAARIGTPGFSLSASLAQGFVFDTPDPDVYTGPFVSVTFSGAWQSIRALNNFMARTGVVMTPGLNSTMGAGVTLFTSPDWTTAHVSKGFVPLGISFNWGSAVSASRPSLSIALTYYLKLLQFDPNTFNLQFFNPLNSFAPISALDDWF